MPRYFFDIDNGTAVRDTMGQDFPDQEAVQTEAFRRAAVYGGDISHLRASGIIVVTVRDASESIVLTVRLVCQIEHF